MVRRVSHTELRNHFEQYLDMVFAGNTLIITKYGKEVVMMASADGNDSSYNKKEGEC